MKKIEAIIRPHLLDAVRSSLQELDIHGMTISEVQGYGRQRGHTETYRGAEYQIEFVPKIKIEVIIPDEVEDSVINAVVKAARTGKFGDGKLFVLPVDEAIRIRTEERGEAAL
jgi:nitrogen regulatory protein PII